MWTYSDTHKRTPRRDQQPPPGPTPRRSRVHQLRQLRSPRPPCNMTPTPARTPKSHEIAQPPQVQETAVTAFGNERQPGLSSATVATRVHLTVFPASRAGTAALRSRRVPFGLTTSVPSSIAGSLRRRIRWFGRRRGRPSYSRCVVRSPASRPGWYTQAPWSPRKPACASLECRGLIARFSPMIAQTRAECVLVQETRQGLFLCEQGASAGAVR